MDCLTFQVNDGYTKIFRTLVPKDIYRRVQNTCKHTPKLWKKYTHRLKYADYICFDNAFQFIEHKNNLQVIHFVQTLCIFFFLLLDQPQMSYSDQILIHELAHYFQILHCLQLIDYL